MNDFWEFLHIINVLNKRYISCKANIKVAYYYDNLFMANMI